MLSQIYEYNMNNYDWHGAAQIIKAQQILNTSNKTVSPVQWQQLSQLLYKTTLDTNVIGGSFVGNATRVILDWSQNANVNVDIRKVFVYSKAMAIMLDDWQRELFTLVKKRKQTLKVCIFGDSFWVVVKRPTTSLVFKYSQDYVSLFDKYPTMKCDFLIIGEKQFEAANIPTEANILEV